MNVAPCTLHDNRHFLRDSGTGFRLELLSFLPMPVHSDPADWTDPRQRLGLDGEEEAKRYLETRGFTILAHRWRMGRLEIDLVARRGALVAFVEVKTRWGDAFGSPLEAVTWAKQREIVRVARAWMDREGKPTDIYRFDVIGLRRDLGLAERLVHVEDAFKPGWR